MIMGEVAVSRSAPSWVATVLGGAYTLHFWPPYGDPAVQQAGHYTGTSESSRFLKVFGLCLGGGFGERRGRGLWVLESDLSSAGLLRLGLARGRTWQDAGHREGGFLGELHLGLGPEMLAQLLGEFLADVIWPAQRGRSGVLHADDSLDRPDDPPRVRLVDERLEQAGTRDDLSVGKMRPPHQGTALAAARGPPAAQRTPETVLLALPGPQPGEPAAGAQEPRGLAEHDLGVDPVTL